MRDRAFNLKVLVIMAFSVFALAPHNGTFSIEAVAQPGGGRGGPPPEAVSACEVQNVGEVCSFDSPKGDFILGTCENVKGGVLACVPEGAHPGGPDGEKPPKPE